MNNALHFTILQRCVWARHPQDHAVGEEKCPRGGIVELTSIVTLDKLDGVAKLSKDIGKEI